jgi:hypothetical protein
MDCSGTEISTHDLRDLQLGVVQALTSAMANAAFYGFAGAIIHLLYILADC